jgi:hypothetical protein
MNIDWRAFWASFATVIICLVVYGILIEPLIKKYGIQIVNPNPDPKPTTPVVEKKS